MKRLSNPITDLKQQYEIVVIGSGYGGSIAASRMARGGKKVCLLEKGKEFLPKEFPSNIAEATVEMQVSKDGKHIGSPNGLYEFVAGKEISVFKGCGLGGTSLVNANVSIEAEDRVFKDEHWPFEFRNNLPLLKEGVQHAWDMLKPNPYPDGRDGYPKLGKTEAQRKSAASFGNTKFKLADINVKFQTGVNHVGVNQNKCNNCGDCVTGCNHSSKNTTQATYLPDAKNHGAEIYTEVDVRYIERAAPKWCIYFQLHGTGREKFDAPLLFILADKVFISGGSLGSTEILLRSKEKGLSLSDMLGKRFTGNGDVLGFGYNCDTSIQGVGRAEYAGDKIEGVGPCITSIIDLRHQETLEDGMTIEEGSVPGPIRSVLIPALIPFSRLIGKDTDSGFRDFISERWREIKSFILGVYRGAVANTQIYLVMTHDDGEGRMHLENDRVAISWPGVGKEKIFEKVNSNLQQATKALGGTYVRNPSWTPMLNYDLVTVHPLGGCIMANDAEHGVVDHKGQVFSEQNGVNVHSGLYVMDGAIIPRPLGTNPLLTISAVAERNCKLIAADMGIDLTYDFPTPPILPLIEATGIRFTETMTGFFSTEEKTDYKKAFDHGKEKNSPFTFTLTIQSLDVDEIIKKEEHKGGMIGTVIAPKLSAYPLMATQGIFNLFVKEPNDPLRKKMKYAMCLHSVEGDDFYFSGFKDIHDDKGFDVWSDTTVLFISVFKGTDDSGEKLGLGMLKIKPGDFVKQLTTMKAVHAKNKLNAIEAVAKFGKFFGGNVWQTYVAK